MKFAAICGFKKLLVLSGSANINDVENWIFSNDLKPDYYLQNLRYLHNIIEKISNLQ